MNTLPNELLARVFLYLPPRLFYGTLPLVSRLWKRVSATAIPASPIEGPAFCVTAWHRTVQSHVYERLPDLVVYEDFRKMVKDGVGPVWVAGKVRVELRNTWSAPSSGSLVREFETALRESLGTTAFVADLTIDLMDTYIGSPAAFEKIAIPLLTLAPTNLLIDTPFLQMWDWSQPARFPSVRTLTISGAAKERFYEEALTQALSLVRNVFPDVQNIKIQDLALRLGRLVPNVMETVPSAVRELVTFVHQPYLLDPLAGTPRRLDPHVFVPLHLVEVFPHLTHIGYLALFPSMWSELESHSPEAIPNLKSIQSVCIFMETEPERMYVGEEGIREITDGFSRYMPNLQSITCVLELRSRNYPTLGDPDEWTLLDSVDYWDYFFRNVPARKFIVRKRPARRDVMVSVQRMYARRVVEKVVASGKECVNLWDEDNERNDRPLDRAC
ncbi:hypothetical protein M427DRAFT_55658, partial [Gonapodya prolifera JEL478]